MADNDRYSTVFIGLGSNLGNKQENIIKAIEQIGKLESTNVLSVSSFYKTSPVGAKDQDWFINAVIKVATRVPVGELMRALLKVEKNLGRVRSEKWGARTIDLDILFYGDEIITDDHVTVPHKHLTERRFVLEPLNEVACDFLHPVHKKLVSELLAELDSDESVEKILNG